VHIHTHLHQAGFVKMENNTANEGFVSYCLHEDEDRTQKIDGIGIISNLKKMMQRKDEIMMGLTKDLEVLRQQNEKLRRRLALYE